MPKPASVLEEQLKARQRRVKDVARLFRPIAQGDGSLPAMTLVTDIAVLLLDMSDLDWDRLVGLRRIEASLRRNARHRTIPAAEKPSRRKPGETRGMRKRGETLEGLRAAREAYQKTWGTDAWWTVEPPEPLSEPGDGHG